jgi:hypothetical protein
VRLPAIAAAPEWIKGKAFTIDGSGDEGPLSDVPRLSVYQEKGAVPSKPFIVT